MGSVVVGGAMHTLTSGQREVLRALLQGSSLEDLSWALGESGENVLVRAHESLVALDPDSAGVLEDADRRRVCEYLLERQSPGQAAGTWELFKRSPQARRWAAAAREQLADLYRGEPLDLPGADDTDADPPRWGHEAATDDRPRTLAERRAARSSQRRVAHLQIAVAQEMSPFRSEALEKHSEGQERVKLPHYASRPARIALNVLAVALVAGIVFCAVVEVPTYADAKVLVTSLEKGDPGPQQGVSVVALFPPDVLDDLDTGLSLRVELPETQERVGMELSYVEDDVLSPREIVDRYDIPDPQSRRVRDPAAVAVADLRVPDDAPSRGSFEGVVTEEANVRTGSQRIISLLF
jgi:hypothetical protein